MAYCTAAQVRAICDTDITDPELTELIEETDAWMDIKLDTAAMNVFMLRLISRTWTAVRAFLKDPNAQSLGEYREDREAALLKLNAMLDEMLKDAMAETGTGIAMSYGYIKIPFG